MSTFRFLHAADIHLDSPLLGLSRYEGLPIDEIRSATRAAFDNMIQCAIEEAVDFVVIAGDLFDGDWRDMGTGLYFARAMGRLDQARIPAFILSGNHDAASVISKNLPWPPNVRLFGSRKPESHSLPHLAVAVHGQSFSTPAVTDNLVLAYPKSIEHNFNIGMLHTALAGRQGHAPYAPCSVNDLRSKGYDYWALGHVHEFEVVNTNPYIVFPGNLQGRKITEAGVKGAVIVTVVDHEVTAVDRIELDVIRWARVEVDCAGSCQDDVVDLARTKLSLLQKTNASGRPIIARVILVGETVDAGILHDGASSLRDEIRAIASSISPDLFVEKVTVLVTEPLRDDTVLSEGLSALINDAANDSSLAVALAEDLEKFMLAAASTLGDPEEGELRTAAARGDWPIVLETVSTALRARLTKEA
jgi:exonuclease SbcD